MQKIFTLFVCCLLFVSVLRAQTCRQPLTIQPCDMLNTSLTLSSPSIQQVDSIVQFAIGDGSGFISNPYGNQKEWHIDIDVPALAANQEMQSISISLALLTSGGALAGASAQTPVLVALLDSIYDCDSMHHYGAASQVFNAPYGLSTDTSGVHGDSCNYSTFVFYTNRSGLHRLIIEKEDTASLLLYVGRSFTYQDSVPAQQAAIGCAHGQIEEGTLIDSSICGYKPFRSAKPFYEVELNGNVLETDSIISFNLGVANELCLRSYIKNTTGMAGLATADFHFGTHLEAYPIVRDTTDFISNIWHWRRVAVGEDFPLLYADNTQASDGWVYAQKMPYTQPAWIQAIPSLAQLALDTTIAWVANARHGDIRRQCPAGNCHEYEFCFEVWASSNIPDSTKVLTVLGEDYPPNDYPTIIGHGDTVITKLLSCLFSPICQGGGSTTVPARRYLYFDVEDPVLLSLDLVSFDVHMQAGAVGVAEWVLAEGSAAEGFVLQRSRDTRTWEDIATLAATQARRYTYEDKALLSGYNYYRLLLQEASVAEQEYSAVRVINFETTSEEVKNTLRLQPNPSKGSTWVLLQEAKSVDIEVYDALGRLVYVERAMQASNRHELPPSALGVAGIYTVRVLHAGKTLGTQLLIKQ